MPKPSLVGQVVRFNSHIQAEDGGILSLERGIVVGFDADRRKCTIVWNDGESGIYRCKDLATMPGTVGDIADSTVPAVGPISGRTMHLRQRSAPIKDAGRKPVPPPRREIPNPLPRNAFGTVSWDVREIKRVECIVSDKPHVDDKGRKHEKSFIRFAVPIVTMSIRASHWDESDALIVTHSRLGLKVQYQYGDKPVERVKPHKVAPWLIARGGNELMSTVMGMCTSQVA